MANSIDLYRLPQPVVTTTPVAGGSLVAGTTYYYKVVPWRGGTAANTTSYYNFFNGPTSEEISFTADATNKSVRLTVSNPDNNAQRYQIFRSTTSGVYPDTAHLGTLLAGTSASYDYTDTGIATAAMTYSFADDINIDIPLINIRGFWSERTLSTPSGVVGYNWIGGQTLIDNELNGRVIYFKTGNGRFKDGDGITELRYARVRYNTTTVIYFESILSVLPAAGDEIKISWTEEDIYQQSITDSWGVIDQTTTNWDQAGQDVIVKNGFKNYTINAYFGLNYFASPSDWGMFSFLPKSVVSFGQICRFSTNTYSAIYIGNCNSDYGSGDSVQLTFYGANSANDTLQTGFSVAGELDITGMRWCFKTKYRNPAQGNTSFQPGFSYTDPALWGKNRLCGCTFEGVRAVSPGLILIFNNNNFFECGQAIESSYNVIDGLVTVNSISDHIRPASYIETRMINYTAIGGANVFDMWANDTNSTYVINPHKDTLPRILGTTEAANSTHWESTPNGGKLWVQYQMGFNFSDAETGEPISGVCVEVFDKDNNPLYADLIDRSRELTKGSYSSSSLVRNVRGGIYLRANGSDWRLAYFAFGRYYGYQNTTLRVGIGEKGETAGSWGNWRTPEMSITTPNFTGYVYTDEGEQLKYLDTSKTYLSHVYGDVKYWGYVSLKSASSYDGVGAKAGSDEYDVMNPTGYTVTERTAYIRIDARKTYSDANGRIPLLEYDAYSVMKGDTYVYAANIIETFVPWTVRITKEGYETQEFSFTPSGLYEKEFVVSLKPQITKLEDDNGNVFDRVDKTNSGTTNLRRKIVKAS